MGAAAADAAGSRREKAAAARRQGGGALTWTQADDFEAPARLRVRAPELYGRRSAPRAIADLRLRPNNYRGPNPEMGAICNTWFNTNTYLFNRLNVAASKYVAERDLASFPQAGAGRSGDVGDGACGAARRQGGLGVFQCVPSVCGSGCIARSAHRSPSCGLREFARQTGPAGRRPPAAHQAHTLRLCAVLRSRPEPPSRRHAARRPPRTGPDPQSACSLCGRRFAAEAEAGARRTDVQH